MRTLIERWTNFWFTPAEPTNLGICRILVFGAFLVRYLVVPLNVSGFLRLSQNFYNPIPLLGLFHVPVLPASWIQLMEIVWLLSLLLSCGGLWTRVSTAIAFCFGFYLIWLPHNFGKLHHTDMITVLTMGIMMLSRCGAACSVDRWLKKRRKGAAFVKISPSGEYTWPIRMVWVVIVTIFFAAGISKLRNSGLAWVFSDNLAVMLIKVNYLAYIGYPPLLNWGLYLGQHVLLCKFIAGGTLALELSSPLALFSRRARRVLAPAMFGLLLGILLFFMPGFVELLVCQVFWVPWDRVGRWFKVRFHLLPLPQPLPEKNSGTLIEGK